MDDPSWIAALRPSTSHRWWLERYIAITTFTRDGTPKSVPVWPGDAGDGNIGVVTSLQTWKVKRINNECRVEVHPATRKAEYARAREPCPGRRRS